MTSATALAINRLPCLPKPGFLICPLDKILVRLIKTLFYLSGQLVLVQELQSTLPGTLIKTCASIPILSFSPCTLPWLAWVAPQSVLFTSSRSCELWVINFSISMSPVVTELWFIIQHLVLHLANINLRK